MQYIYQVFRATARSPLIEATSLFEKNVFRWCHHSPFREVVAPQHLGKASAVPWLRRSHHDRHAAEEAAQQSAPACTESTPESWKR